MQITTVQITTVQLYRMECVILRCYGDTNYLGNRLGRLHTKQFCVCICCALVFTGNISHNHNHPPRAFVSHDTNQPITELYSSHMTQTGQSSNHSTVFWSRDTNQPITELYSSHMTQTGQSQSCILVTLHKPANNRAVF